MRARQWYKAIVTKAKQLPNLSAEQLPGIRWVRIFPKYRCEDHVPQVSVQTNGTAMLADGCSNSAEGVREELICGHTSKEHEVVQQYGRDRPFVFFKVVQPSTGSDLGFARPK